jgi:hypothetical protein
VKAQNRERQRIRKQRWGSGNRSDKVGISVTPFLIWDAIKQFHPYKKEILIVVRTLNSIGANRNIIAAALDLQGWKTFYGGSEWTEEDVNGLLKEFRAQKNKENNIFGFKR